MVLLSEVDFAVTSHFTVTHRSPHYPDNPHQISANMNLSKRVDHHHALRDICVVRLLAAAVHAYLNRKNSGVALHQKMLECNIHECCRCACLAT